MTSGLFSMKNKLKREFGLFCMMATVRLLNFVPFPSKFRNGTEINNVGS
jgi:hypothetical protein